MRDQVAQALALAEAYTSGANGAKQGALQAFFDCIADLVKQHDPAQVLAELSQLEAEDDIHTFVERTLLSQVARGPAPTLDHMKLLFECQDYESLRDLAKNPAVDEMNRSRARFEAERIKKAYMSQFDPE